MDPSLESFVSAFLTAESLTPVLRGGQTGGLFENADEIAHIVEPAGCRDILDGLIGRADQLSCLIEAQFEQIVDRCGAGDIPKEVAEILGVVIRLIG